MVPSSRPSFTERAGSRRSISSSLSRSRVVVYLRRVDERELLGRLRGGDKDAFDSIFREYYPHLTGVAESMLREREAAEDMAQDVMMELWRRRETLVLETSLRAYLFRAVRNRSLNYLRHLRIAPRVDPDAAAAHISSSTADRGTLEK